MIGGGVKPVGYVCPGPFRNKVVVAFKYGNINVLGRFVPGPATEFRAVSSCSMVGGYNTCLCRNNILSLDGNRTA